MTTLFFDLNGTLFDDVDLAHACCAAAFEQAGFPPLSKKEFTEKYDMPIGAFYKNCNISLKQIRKHELMLRRTFFAAFAEGMARQPLRKGAKELLEACRAKGHRIVVLTSFLRDVAREQLAGAGLGEAVADIIGRTEKLIEENAPKGKLFLQYLRNNAIDPARAVLIGDTAEEVVLARGLRIKSIAIEGGWSTPDRLAASRPDYQIASLAAAQEILFERPSAP